MVFPLSAARAIWGFFTPAPVPLLGTNTLWETATVLFGFLLEPSHAPRGLTSGQILSALAIRIVHPVLSFVFSAGCAVLLALRTKLRYEPTRPSEVWIPLIATFLLSLASLTDQLPGWLGGPLKYPGTWALKAIGVAAVLSVVGIGFALWGLLHLRRNFSVFVEVRDVVTTGPYRFVRHPLYVGEILMVLGLLLSAPTRFGIALLIALTVLQVVRAGMEERRLCDASPEYAGRMQMTGGFFPRLLGRRSSATSSP